MARRVAESAAALVALRNVMQRVQQACDHAHRPASQVSSKHVPFVLLLLLFFFFFVLFFTLLEPRLLDFTQSLLRVCFSCVFST
jgi:hypothetical protein